MTPDTPKPVSKKPAASKKGEINKSAEIRKVASGMKAKGEKPRPVVIIDVLKKQGIVVSSPQVSMVLKKMGFRSRKRRKGGKVASGRVVKSATSKTIKIKVDDLVKAQKVVAQMGGLDRALAALHALKGFE
jgi:hypothetical protein